MLKKIYPIYGGKRIADESFAKTYRLKKYVTLAW